MPERSPSRSTWPLIVGCVLLVGWQASYFVSQVSIPRDYKVSGVQGGGGAHLDGLRQFLTFFRASGLYPLASLSPEPPPRGEAFAAWADAHGDSLVMEVVDTYRMGDRGRVFLLWLDSLRGREPSYWRVNGLFFVASLLLFFASFWRRGHALFGFTAALLVGSSSFQLFETYANNNVFGLAITTLLALMALNAFALTGEARKVSAGHMALALASGCLLALVREIRSEPVVLLLSVLVAYLAMPGVSWRNRGLLAGALVAAFLATGAAVTWRLESLFERTRQFVTEKGGHPYTGPRRLHHLFWHPVFCGLGDFAPELGYEWNDFVAFEYGLSKLRQTDPGLWPTFPGKAGTGNQAAYFMDTSWDAAGLYEKKLEDDPRYEPVLREKILADVKAHPLTFVKVYASRLARVLWDTSGVQLNVPHLFPLSLNFPGFGLVALPALWLARRRRDGLAVRAILFSVPLLATALAINSDLGTQYYSVYAVFSFLVLAGYAVEALLAARRRPLAAGGGQVSDSDPSPPRLTPGGGDAI